MEEKITHVMELINSYPTGAQEWRCKLCGYHFIIQWPPHYKRIILDYGDNDATHSGGVAGLVMGDTEVSKYEVTAFDIWAKNNEDLFKD